MKNDRETNNLPVDKILQLLDENYPVTRPALRYENPFQLLIATILAAQCTDARVNKVTEKLFKKYRGPEDFAKAHQKELEEDIKTCGLFRTKSKNIIAASKAILEEHGGDVPQELEQLIKLPGVGRKTANVVLANAFGIPAFAVDTHVFRVSRRLGLANKDTVLGVEYDLMENIPKDLWIKAHHWLIYHGRGVCKARKPHCERCHLKAYCPTFKKETI